MMEQITNNLNTIWLWISTNWPTIFGYAAMLIAILYKEVRTRLLVKLTKKHLKLATEQDERIEKGSKKLEQYALERGEYLKQIKHERQQKNFYKQKLDKLIKLQNRAA